MSREIRHRRTFVLAAAATVIGALTVTGLTVNALAADGPNGPVNAPRASAQTQKAAQAQKAPAPAAPGQLFLPLTGCNPFSGAIGKKATKSLTVRGTCAIPTAATTVVAAIRVSGAKKSAQLVVSPTGDRVYAAKKVDGFGTVTVPLNPVSASTDLALTAKGSALKVKFSLRGYYLPYVPPAPTAAPLWAFVAIDGTVQQRNDGVESATHTSTGNYFVTFNRDVSSCSFAVAPYAYNYVVAVGPALGSANQAHVFIHDETTGKPAHDNSFYITAFC